jgi:predicted DsbA family dithiol-disulfide isomerase
LDGKEIREWLNDEEKLKALIEEEREGRVKQHINGVPHYVVNERLVIGGGQPESEWMEAFASLKGETA